MLFNLIYPVFAEKICFEVNGRRQRMQPANNFKLMLAILSKSYKN